MTLRGGSLERRRGGHMEKRISTNYPFHDQVAWRLLISRFNSSLPALFLAFAAVVAVSMTIMRSGSIQQLGNYKDNKLSPPPPPPAAAVEACNHFDGRWVYDNSSRPLYSGAGCSFMNDEVACDKFGRKNTRYQGWRWQPRGCDLPRFDALDLLQRLRGKRLVYVGDSLNRNQWSSMVCLLESYIPTSSYKSMEYNKSLMSFKAKEFNASIEFYWSPLLVESDCDDPVKHRLSNRTITDSIENHAKYWGGADVLIFNSYLWWKKSKMKIMYGSIEDVDKKYKVVEMIEAFELALKTWSNWLELYIDTLKTQVFFMSLSPTHIWAGNWDMAANENCYSETEPLTEDRYTGRGADYVIMRMVEATVESLKNKGVIVNILNITKLSEFRKDGHPSIYRKQWTPLTEKQLANPRSYADCTHWCLPGVPDVWNELLYASIISK